jgi:hypothetical protein
MLATAQNPQICKFYACAKEISKTTAQNETKLLVEARK